MRHVRKNFNVFLDGKGYAGQAEEFNAPKLTLKTDDFQGAGMMGPASITMGHEKLETDFSLIAYDADAWATFSVNEGDEVTFTVRELLESVDGTQAGAVHVCRGKVKEIDGGTSKAGEKASMKISMDCTYYRQTIDGRVVHEVDVLNMVWVKDGVDLLEKARSILGR
jgi:hypothetical protein